MIGKMVSLGFDLATMPARMTYRGTRAMLAMPGDIEQVIAEVREVSDEIAREVQALLYSVDQEMTEQTAHLDFCDRAREHGGEIRLRARVFQHPFDPGAEPEAGAERVNRHLLDYAEQPGSARCARHTHKSTQLARARAAVPRFCVLSLLILPFLDRRAPPSRRGALGRSLRARLFLLLQITGRH